MEEQRRTFLKAFAGGCAVVSLSPLAAHATPLETQGKVDELLGGKPLNENRVNITLPEIAENGGTVPLSVSVDSPMVETDYVKTLHIFADDNPLPEVATYFFGPHNGKADISVRIRLGKTQKVVALAEMNNGDFHIARKQIKVTLGGCGG